MPELTDKQQVGAAVSAIKKTCDKLVSEQGFDPDCVITAIESMSVSAAISAGLNASEYLRGLADAVEGKQDEWQERARLSIN